MSVVVCCRVSPPQLWIATVEVNVDGANSYRYPVDTVLLTSMCLSDTGRGRLSV